MFIKVVALSSVVAGIMALGAMPALAQQQSAAVAASQSISGSESTSLATASPKLTQSSSTSQTSSQANGQSITQNYEATGIPHQAPELVVAPSNSTAPCVISGGVGASFPGGAVSAGFGIKDPGCEMRARVELLNTMGYKEAGLTLLCDDDVKVRQAFVNMGKSCYPSPDTALIAKH
jgi:hypothetical protein